MSHDGLRVLRDGFRYDVDKIDDELGIITEHDITLVHDRKNGELLIRQERPKLAMGDIITNALDDLETAAEYVEQDGTEYDAEMIRACVETLRSEVSHPTPTEHKLHSLVEDFEQLSNSYVGEDKGREPTQYQHGGMDAMSYAAHELSEVLQDESTETLREETDA